VRIWPVASGVAWRTLHNVATTPAILIPSLAFPLFFFTAFAGGLSQVARVPGFDYEPGYTTFQFGFGIARDFETGFAKRLLLASPNRTGIVLGYALAAAARFVLTATVLTIVAVFAGIEVFGGPFDVAGLYLLALIVNAAAILWAAGVAMRFRTMQAGPVMQMPVFLILFFAPVYVPLPLLTGWIEGVATVNPFTYVLEAARSMLAGEEVHVGAAFGFAIALVLLFSLWAVRGLRKAEAAG
jgi:ABC-2 type transport system permease protein